MMQWNSFMSAQLAAVGVDERTSPGLLKLGVAHTSVHMKGSRGLAKDLTLFWSYTWHGSIQGLGTALARDSALTWAVI